MNDGRFDSEAALRAVHALARRAIIFDMEKSAEQAGTVINAVLFGALAGANVLDIERRHFEQAIKTSGKSLDANMRGFELGFAAARGDMPVAAKIAETRRPMPWPHSRNFLSRRVIHRERVSTCQDYQSRSCAEDIAKVQELTLDRSLEGATRGKLTIEGRASCPARPGDVSRLPT
jgi:indolepyruvate ferredoxin oxidoreductase beta subunit